MPIEPATPAPTIVVGSDQIVVSKEGKNVLELGIKRHPEGVSLYIKSEAFEKFFKGSATSQKDGNWGKVYSSDGDVRRNWDDAFLRYKGRIMDSGTNNLLSRDGTFQLSYLRLVGIADGKEIVFRGLFPHEECKAYLEGVKPVIERLYKDLFKPFDMSITFKAREVL
jgi:hypothetical protein